MERMEDTGPGFLVPLTRAVITWAERRCLFSSLERWFARRGLWTTKRPPDWFMEAYVVASLAIGWHFLEVGPGAVCFPLGLAFVAYRLVEMMVTQLSSKVFRLQANGTGGERSSRVSSYERTILLLLLNVAEVVVYFAVLYLALQTHYATREGPQIDSWIDALYQSSRVLFAGGGGDPQTGLAKLLEVAEFSWLVLLLVIVGPVVISAIRLKEEKHGDEGRAIRPDAGQSPSSQCPPPADPLRSKRS